MEPNRSLLFRHESCRVIYNIEDKTYISSTAEAIISAQALLAIQDKTARVFNAITILRSIVTIHLEKEPTKMDVLNPLQLIQLPGPFSIEEFIKMMKYDPSWNENEWTEYYIQWMPKKYIEKKEILK